MADDKVKILPGTSFRIAIAVAIAADVLQFAVMPMFIEGAASPADDLVDVGVGAFLTYLLGRHWEFLPSFLGKLVPGIDMVPFWTLAVANVYRKQKQLAIKEGILPDQPIQNEPPHS
jgi:hypothetical protein